MPDCRVIKATEKEDYLLALSFVLAHEKTCCALTRKILDRTDGVHLIVHAPARQNSARPLVDGVFFFLDDDVILPCLSGIKNCGLKALASFLEGKKLFCISALEDDIRKIHSCFTRLAVPPKLVERREYLFFEHQDEVAARTAIAALPQELEIRMAGTKDAELILPLHFAYMREEVLINGRELNEPFERRQLIEALQNQVVVIATEKSGGNALAKAGTNAIACKVMQLGGVYTDKSARGRGIAAALTAFLAQSAAQKGMATVLFVNKKNKNAISAYRKAGFRDNGRNYTIEYWEN